MAVCFVFAQDWAVSFSWHESASWLTFLDRLAKLSQDSKLSLKQNWTLIFSSPAASLSSKCHGTVRKSPRIELLSSNPEQDTLPTQEKYCTVCKITLSILQGKTLHSPLCSGEGYACRQTACLPSGLLGQREQKSLCPHGKGRVWTLHTHQPSQSRNHSNVRSSYGTPRHGGWEDGTGALLGLDSVMKRCLPGRLLSLPAIPSGWDRQTWQWLFCAVASFSFNKKEKSSTHRVVFVLIHRTLDLMVLLLHTYYWMHSVQVTGNLTLF